MKKTILTMLAAVALAFNVAADDYMMTVHLKDGQTTNFVFANQPTATFEDGEMVVTELGGAEKTKFILSEVEKMTVSPATGVSSATLDKNAVLFSLKGGLLRGTGLAEGTRVRIYNTAGTTVETAVVANGGIVEINTESYAKGVYVVAAGKTTFKFMK